MKFELILLYQNNKQLELGCYDSLTTIDNYTTQYNDSEKLLESLSHVIKKHTPNSNVQKFLSMCQNPSLNIKFYDKGGYLKTVNVLYKGNKRKLNPVSIYNDIVNYMQKDESYLKAGQLLNKFIYMFNSEFNVNNNYIYKLKKDLNDPLGLPKKREKSFKKFIQIIKNDLVTKSGNEEYDQLKYVNLRIIDSYITNIKESIISKEDREDFDNTKQQNPSFGEDYYFSLFLNTLPKNERRLRMADVYDLYIEFLHNNYNYHGHCENKEEKKKEKVWIN